MKQILILSFFSLLQLGAFAQFNLNPFLFNESSWVDSDLKIDPELKKEIIIGDQIPEIIKDGFITMEEYLEDFIPIYLNNDTLIDFIYQGASGGESILTEIYINDQGRLKSVKSEMGRIISLEQGFPNSPILIFFEQYGCCDEPLNYLQQWTIIPSSSDIEILLSNKFHYYKKTEMPKKLDKNLIFKVKNTPYTLRATPEIINNNEFSYHFGKGNIISEYGIGDIGHVFASKTDATGRVWWFVIMNPTKHEGLYCVDLYPNRYWIGWISSRYLDIINVR